MVAGVLAFFPYIEQYQILAAVDPGLDVVNTDFADAPSGVLDDLQKPGRMLLCHEIPHCLRTAACIEEKILSKNILSNLSKFPLSDGELPHLEIRQESGSIKANDQRQL
jgi:hypothetical protein